MSPSKTKALAAVLLLVTFVVGAIAGAAADRIVMIRGGFRGPRSAEFFVRRLDHRLHFSDQQRRQVTVIIGRGQQRIATVWAGVRPAIGREIEQTNIEIDRVLTPEQRVEFTKIRMKLMPHR